MDTPASLLHPCLHPTGVLIRSGKTRHPFGRRTRTGRGLRPPLPCPVPKLRLGLKHANEFVSFSFCLSVSFFFQLLCLLTFARGVQQRMSESRGTSPAARGRGVARRGACALQGTVYALKGHCSGMSPAGFCRGDGINACRGSGGLSSLDQPGLARRRARRTLAWGATRQGLCQTAGRPLPGLGLNGLEIPARGIPALSARSPLRAQDTPDPT